VSILSSDLLALAACAACSIDRGETPDADSVAMTVRITERIELALFSSQTLRTSAFWEEEETNRLLTGLPV